MSKLLLSFVTILTFNSCFGWGQIGHRVVGEIAERHLSPKTKAAVRAILGSQTLAEASTWGDDIRSDSNPRYKTFTPWHFVEIPDGMTYDQAPKSKDGDVIVAIENMINILKDKNSTTDQKVESLRLLVHFVGDIHQPLHVGNGRDMGGNLCFVKFFGEYSNLHAVWDEKIVGAQALSFSELTNFADKANASKILKLQSSTVRDWAAESQALRSKVYPVVNSGKSNYCKVKSDDPPIPADAVPALSYEYVYNMKPIVNQRLMEGGIRLAGILESIFSKN